MNYSKNLSKRKIGKRMIISWVIVAIVSSMISGGVGYGIKAHITATDKGKDNHGTVERVSDEFTVYGAYDNTFKDELSLDWKHGDLDFQPLSVPMDEEQQEFVFYLCDGYNLEFSLVMAVIEHESYYQADVISKTNDYGLMQINKVNHEQLTEILGLTDFLDPYQNIRAGCFTLRKLFEKYQDADMVLMAYNMGENGANRLWENGVFSTSYTESVRQVQRKLNKQLDGAEYAGNLESD